jgi:hypothetical protein
VMGFCQGGQSGGEQRPDRRRKNHRTARYHGATFPSSCLFTARNPPASGSYHLDSVEIRILNLVVNAGWLPVTDSQQR